jgi:Tripartite tricarboxylate transporter TctB family
MGAGFFPVALGLLLAALGIAIAAGARRAQLETAETNALRPEWRGWICISLSVVAFVVLGRHGGLLPATFAITFIAALGDRENTALHALLLATSISAICIVVFWWALKLQLPLFAWG